MTIVKEAVREWKEAFGSVERFRLSYRHNRTPVRTELNSMIRSIDKRTPQENRTCSPPFGCVGSEQLQLHWVRVGTLELAAIKWRQLLIESVLSNEDLEHVLDLLGDFTTSAHSFTEF